MTKPQVTLREDKGLALDYNELDQNFKNLRDATVSIDADGNVILLDLNSGFKLTPGDNITFDVVDNEVTINSTASGGGEGTIQTGAQGRLPFYVDSPTGTSLGQKELIYSDSSFHAGIRGAGTLDTRLVSSGPTGYISVSFAGVITLVTGTGSTINALAQTLSIGNTAQGVAANIRPNAFGTSRTVNIFSRHASADGASLQLSDEALITTVNDKNIKLSPNGTGIIELLGPTKISANTLTLSPPGSGNLVNITPDSNSSGLSLRSRLDFLGPGITLDGGTVNGDIILWPVAGSGTGTIQFPSHLTSQTPNNTTTPVTWLRIKVVGLAPVTGYIPVYQ